VLFTDDKIVDVYAIGDTIKATSRAAIQDLHKHGITTYMLTGDNHVTAQAIASHVGITNVIADVNPEMKAGVVQKIKQEVGEKNIVVMV
jgi:Cu+-exporting ATPase